MNDVAIIAGGVIVSILLAVYELREQRREEREQLKRRGEA